MKRFRSFLLALLGLSLGASAQQRTVSITVDDLPYVSRTHTALTVTGFVNEDRVQGLGLKAGPQILRQWIRAGLDLGNHTYSHSDINELSVPQIEDEILRGETTVARSL